MNKLTKSIRHFNIGTMITGILSKLIDSLTQATKAAFQRHAPTPLQGQQSHYPTKHFRRSHRGVLFKILSVIQCYQSSDNNFQSFTHNNVLHHPKEIATLIFFSLFQMAH